MVLCVASTEACKHTKTESVTVAQVQVDGMDAVRITYDACPDQSDVLFLGAHGSALAPPAAIIACMKSLPAKTDVTIEAQKKLQTNAYSIQRVGTCMVPAEMDGETETKGPRTCTF